ncbi:hypothetical protein [Gordonia sp. 852002-50395_SCH5434458]|uniref:hypothetical protein n=1 Tax=Gordonia sp. 852002-50395_SCH5434458 TaxID=1834090 RepID=UPI0007EB498A|nr:hypothetical protein [Gordonia sp. 852002-50395_SCH5434458]OBC01735.1 hypothetical protein A5785_17200 [Gordonia sp. 852002-50395_SCH5434458]
MTAETRTKTAPSPIGRGFWEAMAEGIVRGSIAPDDLHPTIRAGVRPYLDAVLDAGVALVLERLAQCATVDEVVGLLTERLAHQARWRAEARQWRRYR